MTFRYLLNVSFEGPCSDSSAGSSSAGGGGGGAGGAAASEGRAVDGVRVTAGGSSGGGVVGAGNGEDNRSSAGEPGSTGAGGEVNGTAAVGGLVVSAQGVGVGVFLAAFILTAVAGNLMVILSVACNRHLQTVTNYFIVNLAVADLLLSTTVLPFSATMEVLGFWAFGRAFCDVWAAVDVLCCTASILSLCTISVDRYVGVRHSLKYPAIMTERKAAAILALLWAVALVVSVGPLLGWKEPVPPDERFCGITEEAGYAVFSSLCSFYLPMAVIVVMYCRVYVVARSTTRSLEAGVKRERGKASEVVLRIHCRGASTGSDGAHGGMRSAKGHTFRSSLSVRLLKFSREKKAAKTLAIVVGVFVLCWFPFFFVLPLGFPVVLGGGQLFSGPSSHALRPLLEALGLGQHREKKGNGIYGVAFALSHCTHRCNQPAQARTSHVPVITHIEQMITFRHICLRSLPLSLFR
ncbi:alpha-1D adrenergic receptor isoform X3 [Delphinus delphis]|uniref:alpha-1D adrenergic receptor isoform X3 n=1 Tax=Delphinus delphis TaxID=9728 RepID=UPI0028C41DFE|nr:alpha-1D adrenergic receptor isoform X3 [Delphinus delphis]